MVRDKERGVICGVMEEGRESRDDEGEGTGG